MLYVLLNYNELKYNCYKFMKINIKKFLNM